MWRIAKRQDEVFERAKKRSREGEGKASPCAQMLIKGAPQLPARYRKRNMTGDVQKNQST